MNNFLIYTDESSSSYEEFYKNIGLSMSDKMLKMLEYETFRLIEENYIEGDVDTKSVHPTNFIKVIADGSILGTLKADVFMPKTINITDDYSNLIHQFTPQTLLYYIKQYFLNKGYKYIDIGNFIDNNISEIIYTQRINMLNDQV